MPSLRDSGLFLIVTRHFRAGLQAIASLRDCCRKMRSYLNFVPSSPCMSHNDVRF